VVPSNDLLAIIGRRAPGERGTSHALLTFARRLEERARPTVAVEQRA